MGVHEIAERGFGRGAADYERGRPGYPDAAVDLLRRELELRGGRTVLDLGAGTGKLTRLLVPTGARVLALEPVAGMREQLTAIVPQAELVEGTAEAIGLPDDAVDAVTAATAFHWFDPGRALPEIHRVLRPGGALAVVSNKRDRSVGWMAELSRLIREAIARDADESAVKHARQGDSDAWQAAFEQSELYTPFRTAEFPHVHVADVATHIARVESISYVSTLPAEARARLAGAIERLLRAKAAVSDDPEMVAVPYVTEVFWCTARVSGPGRGSRARAAGRTRPNRRGRR